MSNVVNNLISLIFLVGLITLQIYLSKRKNKWLGLILPTINVIYSIVIILSAAFLGNISIVQIIIQATMSFLLCNTSTMILIVIYFVCREKIKKNENENEDKLIIK